MTDVHDRPPTRPDTRTRPPRPTGGGLFRAMWRWHFFAAFLVAPLLLVLAGTGLIYLFRFQLEPLLHADLMKVEAPVGAGTRAYAVQQEALLEQYPGATVVSVAEPRDVDRSTVFSVEMADGAARDVFVDPYDAQVLGALDPETTVSGVAVRLHADLMAGTWGDRLLELAACWAIVMSITGYVLFVKGARARRRMRAKDRPGARLRSRHGTVGAVVGLGLLMLLVSGLPWTGFWGTQVQELATARGSSLWSTDAGGLSDPTSSLDESLPHTHVSDVPWGMGASAVPRSEVPGQTSGQMVSVANVDTALQVADAEGLRHPMTVALPAADDGVFSVIGYAFDAPTDERTVHVDRYGAQVVSTYGYDDYPVLAQVVSHGIGPHEGRSLGLWSFWGSALLCAAVIFMCLSGPVMWWRRRPSGGRALGAPRGRMPLRSTPWLAAGVVGLGVLLPFFGLSLLAVLALDQLVLRRVPALAGWFATT